MKKLTITILLLHLLTNSLLFAQIGTSNRRDVIFNLPPSVPVPRWVTDVDWEHPNIYKIDAAIAAYESNDIHAGSSEEEENDEEPYRMAYMRWRKKIEPFIQANGSIVEQPDYYNRLLENAINAQAKIKQPAAGARIAGSGNWTILGPVETFDDQKNKINSQVNIYSIAIAPTNPNVLYAGAETGGIFRSADKGLHWVCISDNLPPFTATSIAVDPTNANVVYSTGSGQLIKTIDAGVTWTELTAYNGGNSEKITINRLTGRILIAGNKGVYYSNNGGTTWQQAAGSSADVIWDVEFNPVNLNIAYAVGSESTSAARAIKIFRSTNFGASFTLVNAAALNNVHCHGARFGVTPANGNTVYCITLDDSGPKILKSGDAGISWNLTASGPSNALDMDNWQGFYDLDIMVSPNNANHVILGTRHALKSVDGGNTFTSVVFNLHPDVQCMRAAGNDAYIATDGGVNYSSDFFTNVSNWTVRNNGLTGSEFWGFGQGWDQDIVVGGRYHNGDAALYENYGIGNALYVGAAEDATGHVLHGKKNILGFRDLGTVEIPSYLPGKITPAEYANSIWPHDDYYGSFSSKLMIDPCYSNTYYTGNGNTLWKSVNNGISYSALHDFGSKVWRFDIARSNLKVIYLCTEAAIYKTTDGGTSWIPLSLPTGVTYSYYNTDIAVDQLNDNVVFLCMAQGNPGQKVFKSTNGGATWTNYTGTLTNQPIAFIVSQAGANGGVYAITNGAPAKVYYRDNTMGDWIDYSTGLPKNFNCSQGGIIFYRDNKLRIAGNRGIWESPLYTAGTPVTQPMADKQFVSCSRDTVFFTDYSNLTYSGAQWKWSFPGASYVSSTNVREPKVSFPSPGDYAVSLEVTDASGNKHTRTIEKMITFTADNCAPDTVAGKCLKMDGSNTAINLGKVNLNSNQFSISCWIKPNGLQKSFSQLLAHDPYPNSGYGFGLGFAFRGYSPNLELCYTDNIVNYGNGSGLIADSTAWNFVVLTYSPTGVKIYLNGVPATVNNGPMPVIDLSQSPFYVNKDVHHGQGSAYKGAIDEIKFYNYTLSQNEIREKMHLIQNNPASENGLLKYYQFNRIDTLSGTIHDVAGNFATLVPNNLITVSTAPIATGKVFRKSNVNVGGQHSFPGTGIDLYLKNGSTYPNGEVVAFQLNSAPDQNPDTLPLVPPSKYFIINNYGSNKTFTAPDSIRFSGLTIKEPAYRATDFRLHKRPSGASEATWGNELSRSTGFRFTANNSSITFGAGNNITTFGQLALSVSPLRAADTVAGKCLTTVNAANIATDLGKVNINSNQFSISCWIKPNGLQKSFSQLLAHDPYPGSDYGFGLGFTFQGYSPNLELCYTDNIVNYGNYSGLIADSTTWNFVVLTYSPTGVTIYLNGVPATVNGSSMPVIDLSQSPFYVNKDVHHGQGSAYKGSIDEIKFYNYVLSQNEVREKMHLIQKYPGMENGLIKYFQFNQYNSNTGMVPDLMSNFEAAIPSASLITASTAPVATGKVFRKPNVNTRGHHSFPGTGIDLYLKGGATYPNGEVVAFQLNSAPDQNPGTLPLVPPSKYFIINNYGLNKTFTALDSIRFSNLNLETSAYRATDFRLHKRPSGASGNTWGNELSRSTGFRFMANNSSITFGAGNNITTFGQLALSASASTLKRLSFVTALESEAILNDDAVPTVEFYPNPNKGWGYLNVSSPHGNAYVTLYLQAINGNIVYKAQEQLTGNNGKLMLNLNTLTSGTYILQVLFNTGELITKKVTIVK